MNSSSVFFKFTRREQVMAKWLFRFHCFRDNIFIVWKRCQHRVDSWGNEYLYNARSCVNLSTLQLRQEYYHTNKVANDYCLNFLVQSNTTPVDQIRSQPIFQGLRFEFWKTWMEIRIDVLFIRLIWMAFLFNYYLVIMLVFHFITCPWNTISS